MTLWKNYRWKANQAVTPVNKGRRCSDSVSDRSSPRHSPQKIKKELWKQEHTAVRQALAEAGIAVPPACYPSLAEEACEDTEMEMGGKRWQSCYSDRVADLHCLRPKLYSSDQSSSTLSWIRKTIITFST